MGKGKEHTGDSERLELDTWKKAGGKGTGKKPKHSLMKELVKEWENTGKQSNK